jgi:transposase
MPRTVLGQISGNKRRRRELTPYLRGLIIEKHEAGDSGALIARELKIPPSTISDTLREKGNRNSGKTPKQTGRPLSYSEADKAAVFRVIKENPFMTSAQINVKTGLTLSRGTYRRLLKKVGLRQLDREKKTSIKGNTCCSTPGLGRNAKELGVG